MTQDPMAPLARRDRSAIARRDVPSYYLPSPPYWPITAACALLLTTGGAAAWMNRATAAPYVFAAGLAVLLDRKSVV